MLESAWLLLESTMYWTRVWCDVGKPCVYKVGTHLYMSTAGTDVGPRAQGSGLRAMDELYIVAGKAVAGHWSQVVQGYPRDM